MYCSHRGEIEIESHCATTTAFREYLWQSSPWTMDCSSGELNETESCRAIYNCTLRVSVTGPTTGLSNPCIDTQHLLCLVVYCSRGGEMEAESHRATYNCTLRVSATVLATAVVQSYDNGLLTWWIEWDSDCLISIDLRQWVDGGVIRKYTSGLTVTVVMIPVKFVMIVDTFYIYCVALSQIPCLLHRLVCMSCKCSQSWSLCRWFKDMHRCRLDSV